MEVLHCYIVAPEMEVLPLMGWGGGGGGGAAEAAECAELRFQPSYGGDYSRPRRVR
jgi:hypothetical protein